MDNTIVFDIETKKSFADVGGRDNLEGLGISVIGAYFYRGDKYIAYGEDEIAQFEKKIKNAALLIGFNIKEFDLPVLQPYISFNLQEVPVLDLMDDVANNLGFRASLDNLAKENLGIAKSANGLQALDWYKRGEIQKVKDYCLQDVRVTKELYEHGAKNGHVKAFSRDIMGLVAVPVSWNRQNQPKNIFKTLKDALDSRKSVEIDYVTRSASAGEENKKTRKVDIYKLNSQSFEGYCHLRQAKRLFKIDSVLDARITEFNYNMQEDVQGTLL